MATIPQELQDAWDAAQKALADRDDAANRLVALEDAQQSQSAALASVRAESTAKDGIADQARLTFDQTADRLLAITTPALQAPGTQQAPATQPATQPASKPAPVKS